MPYAYQQLGYPQYPAAMYHQAAFYGGYQQYPQAAAPYSQQPNKMRPGTMQHYPFPAQGGAYQASYMAPATMGGYDYPSYQDGSYPVQQEPAPATSGAASTGATDTKAAAAAQA